MAIEADIVADAAETIDPRGKLVDIHIHAARVKDGPALCPADGVTGWVDAGSQGADRIGETIAVAKSATQRCRVLISWKATPWSSSARMSAPRAKRSGATAR